MKTSFPRICLVTVLLIFGARTFAASPAEVLDSYRHAWLAGDEAGVLALFHDDAIIVPHGRAPIAGKGAMRQFWFPPADGSRTTIDEFTIDVVETTIDGALAHTLSEIRLVWTYEKDGRSTTTTQEATSIALLRRDGTDWKIARQIWTDRNVRRTTTKPPE